MQSDNWKKVKELLDEMLSLDVSERQGAYSNVTGQAPEIISEVESLLAFETEAEDLMKLSAVEFSKDFFEMKKAKGTLMGQKKVNYQSCPRTRLRRNGRSLSRRTSRRKIRAASRT